MLAWPNAPASAEAMVWYDATGGWLTACARRLVGQSLAPPDMAATYERVCGDFWYYALRTLGKVKRGEEWAARYELTAIVTGLLHALLRFESGAVERWRAAESAVGIERAVSPRRLVQLDACIPGAGMDSIHRALLNAASFGRDVCADIATTRGWPWPEHMAAHVLAALNADCEQPPG